MEEPSTGSIIIVNQTTIRYTVADWPQDETLSLHLQIFGPLMLKQAAMKVVEQQLQLSSSGHGDDHAMVLLPATFLTRGAYHIRVVLVENKTAAEKDETCVEERCSTVRPASENSHQHIQEDSSRGKTISSSTRAPSDHPKSQHNASSSNASAAVAPCRTCWSPLSLQVLMCSALDETPLRAGGTCHWPGQTDASTRHFKRGGVLVRRVAVTAHGVGGVPWCLDDARELSFCPAGRVLSDVQHRQQEEVERQAKATDEENEVWPPKFVIRRGQAGAMSEEQGGAERREIAAKGGMELDRRWRERGALLRWTGVERVLAEQVRQLQARERMWREEIAARELEHDAEGWKQLVTEGDADSARLQKELWEMQYPVPLQCRDRPSVVHSFEGSISAGLGAQIHFLTVVLSFAYKTRRMLLTSAHDHWNYAGAACKEGWTCYFEPLSSCTPDEVRGRGTVTRGQGLSNKETVVWVGYGDDGGQCMEGATSSSVYLMSDEFLNFVPQKYEHRGALWWRSQLTRFLFRPRPHVLTHIDLVIQRMGWPMPPAAADGRSDAESEARGAGEARRQFAAGTGGIGAGVVGVHVRRGDKLLGIDGLHAEFIHLHQFRDKAKELVPALRAIYLATDDPDAAAEASESNHHRGTHVAPWLVNPHESRLNGTGTLQTMPGVNWIAAFHCAAAGPDPAKVAACTMDSIAVVWLLGRCQGLVGTSSSNLFRLAFQLSFAQRANASAAASLDLPERGWVYAQDHCIAPPCPQFWFPGP